MQKYKVTTGIYQNHFFFGKKLGQRIYDEKTVGLSFPEENCIEVKSYLDFFNMLPEPFRRQAIENCQKCFNLEFIHEIPDRQHFAWALDKGFNFRETPQGSDYWNRVLNFMVEGKNFNNF